MNGVLEEEIESFWKRMIRKYLFIFILAIIGCIGAFIGGIIIEIWFINNSDIGGYGTWTFDDFSVGTGLLFCLLSFLWIFLIDILPACGYFGAIFGIFWWKIVKEEDKEDIKTLMKREESKELRHKRRKSRGGGGGINFLIFIAFLVIVFIDGNWLITFGNLSFSYFVFAYISAIVWCAIIGGIPGCIIFIIWLVHDWKFSQN